MSDIDKLEQRLAELRAERDAVAVKPTKEDAAERAHRWLDGVQARAAESAALVANGHSTGDAFWSVLAGFVSSDPRLPGYLLVGQEAMVDGFTNRQKTRQLAKLDQQVEAATAELREARKAAALAAVEAEFAGAGEAA